MFYSAQTGGFYSREVHGNNIPADAVAVTAEKHAELLAAQSSGKVIQADADGRPCAVEPPPPPLDTLKTQALAQLRAQRKDVFATLAGLQSEALARSDSTTAQAITNVQQMLRDLPATDLSGCQDEADIQAILTGAWVLAAAAAPTSAQRAFDFVLTA